MRLPAGESCELRPVMTPTKCRSVLPLMRGEQWVAGSRGGGDVKREGLKTNVIFGGMIECNSQSG